MKKAVGIILLALGVIIVIGGLRPARYSGDFNVKDFATLPTLEGGRLKPLDSAARNALLLLSRKQTYRNEARKKISAIEWLMELTMNPREADNRKIFYITNPEVLGLIGVGIEEAEKFRFLFSFDDLRPYIEEIQRQGQLVNEEAQLRTAYERATINLLNSLNVYYRLAHSISPPDATTRIEHEYNLYQTAIEEGSGELEKQQAGAEHDKFKFERFLFYVSRYRTISETASLKIIPPADPQEGPENWENIGDSLVQVIKTGQIDPAVVHYARLVDAYRADDATTFNIVLSSLKDELKRRSENHYRYGKSEYLLNQFEPFYLSSVLYLMVFLVAAISWLCWTLTLNQAAFRLLLLAFSVQAFGLLARMIIQGRPPVTNLYSSAVFVGLVAVLLSIILERIHKNGIGSAVAGMIGFSTLVIAHNLSRSGDTMEMMQAVLDSNFWLATHVVTVTMGYSATFLAGALAIIYILRGLLTRGLDKTTAKGLEGMVYGIVCFALLFSFVGTVLGGIWADQSWGRFWGWDPKENGALMIVIWNALVLHCRWGKVTGPRGIMCLAIFGNVVTSWSWFGTNMLGVGLHAYGFMDKATFWLLMFVCSQILIIGAGLLPLRLWRSPIPVR